MAIDYESLALRLRDKLTAFIVDGNKNPILADWKDDDGNTRSRFVPANDPGRPPFPACFAHIPLVVTEDAVGFNPPQIHDVIKRVQSEVIAQGSVDDIESSGNYAGKLLIDYDTDFTDLDISSQPKQVMPTNHVTNTTSSKTSTVVGLPSPNEDPDTVRVQDPIFESVGDSYEIQRVNAEYRYLSGRLIDLRFQVLDIHDPSKSWHDPRGTVNSVAEQLHDWFVAHADNELLDLCFMVDPFGGIGSITEADMTLDEGTGESQRVYRRDFDVRLKYTKEIDRSVANDEYIERITTTVDTTGPSPETTNTGYDSTETVET